VAEEALSAAGSRGWISRRAFDLEVAWAAGGEEIPGPAGRVKEAWRRGAHARRRPVGLLRGGSKSNRRTRARRDYLGLPAAASASASASLAVADSQVGLALVGLGVGAGVGRHRADLAWASPGRRKTHNTRVAVCVAG
jgi:hypothetical protein